MEHILSEAETRQSIKVLRPAPPEKNPFEAFAGVLPAFSRKEEINAWIRDLRDPEEPGQAARSVP
jgi:hypothetical protein